MRVSRRKFVGLAAAAGSASVLPTVTPGVSHKSPDPSFTLGIASYSLREWPRDRTIEAIQELGAGVVSVKSFHLPYELSNGELAAASAEFRAAGIEIVSGGLVPMRESDDLRGRFDYARACGMPMMVVGPVPSTLPAIEALVQEYDIAVAIHNHGPEDGHFPSPYEVLEHLEGRDPRMGVCLDVGHTARTGVDVVQAAEDAGERLLDVHIKDLRDLTDSDSQCVVGRGAIAVGSLFARLSRVGYRGSVNLEYEIEALDPLDGMLRSFDYMRGVVVGLQATSS